MDKEREKERERGGQCLSRVSMAVGDGEEVVVSEKGTDTHMDKRQGNAKYTRARMKGK